MQRTAAVMDGLVGEKERGMPQHRRPAPRLYKPKFRRYLTDVFLPYVPELRSENPDIADEQHVLWLDGETAQINAIIDPTLRQQLDDLNIVVCKSNPAHRGGRSW